MDKKTKEAMFGEMQVKREDGEKNIVAVAVGNDYMVIENSTINDIPAIVDAIEMVRIMKKDGLRGLFKDYKREKDVEAYVFNDRGEIVRVREIEKILEKHKEREFGVVLSRGNRDRGISR